MRKRCTSLKCWACSALFYLFLFKQNSYSKRKLFFGRKIWIEIGVSKTKKKIAKNELAGLVMGTIFLVCLKQYLKTHTENISLVGKIWIEIGVSTKKFKE